MASQSKAQLLTDAHALLKKRYKLGPAPERVTVLEAVILGICHEGTTREQANQALARFKDQFFDWNEVRVSTLKEIEGALAGSPEPEARAQKVRRFLRQLFVKTYGFTLDGLMKKPLKDAIKALQEYEALKSDYVLATVIQQALGGHAIPVDAPRRRGLERLGVATPEMATDALRAALDRAVPKNRGVDFTELLEELVHDTCVEGDPLCPRCALVGLCPTGKERIAAAKAKPAVAKPKAVSVAVSSKPPAAHAATKTSPAKKAQPAPKSAGKGGKPRPKKS